MGRYATNREQMSSDLDLYTVDADFDEPANRWDDRAELIYAVNDSASLWRSQTPRDGFDMEY